MAKDNSLRVEGATLFYRVRGSGPLLLILPGGHGDADTADALGNELIDRYTVITYDRRGISRSKIDALSENLTLATHSDDAHRLLAALTNERAFVFGSSIGALIGLDLVAHHPDQVAILIVHEPPAFELLPEEERDRAMQLQEEAEEAFRREGVEAGFKKFVELAAVDYNDREPDVELPPPASQRSANLSFFLLMIHRLFVATASTSPHCINRRRGSFPPLVNPVLGAPRTKPPKRWRQNSV
jgi:pimeloyl-ACP methyl ester carboxylesterase